MKKLLFLTLTLATSTSVLAGGMGGGVAYPHARFGVVFTGGQASQDSGVNIAALRGQGYTNATASVGKTKKSSGRLALQYHFTPRWALDVGAVDFGNTNFSANLPTTPAGKSAAQVAQDVANATTKRGNDRAYTAGLQYRMPIASRASINLGVGAVAWKDKQNITVNGTSHQFNADGTDTYVRVGLGYDVSRNISLLTNVERYDLDEPINRWDVGMAVRF